MPIIKEDFASAKQNPVKNENPKTNSSLNSTPKEKPAGLIKTLGTLLPFAPLVYEQFTGEKIPPMTGTLAEMNVALSQLAQSLNQVLQNQQQLWTKLENLEKNANQQLTSLGQQFQSLRLTHTRERKEIDFHPKEPSEEY